MPQDYDNNPPPPENDPERTDTPPATPPPAPMDGFRIELDTSQEGKLAGTVKIEPEAARLLAEAALPQRQITMRRTAQEETPDQAFWSVIRSRANAVAFGPYKTYLDAIMEADALPAGGKVRALPYPGVASYELAKTATELFLMQEAGILLTDGDKLSVGIDAAGESQRLGRTVTGPEITAALRERYLTELEQDMPHVIPYFKRIRERLRDIPLKEPGITANCYGILRSRIEGPTLLELIWSYWHEEAMLVQTMNAVALRFQNRSAGPGLSNLELDSLRPIGNLLWGFIQDEQHRLSVARRAHEYAHQYDLRLHGKAVRDVRPADIRSRFLESFHNLLAAAAAFYRRDDDTTVIADGFPVLNALKGLHFVLTEGAHNQFGDLTWTARSEMMIMQWLLARPEIREFLRSRIMVAYPEDWMDPVDTMKRLQGWGAAPATHFSELARYGEQLLLGVRYGNWGDVNNPASAANWARYWRPEVQSYIHAYRAVTGVDLMETPQGVPQAGAAKDVRYAQPSALIRNRLQPAAARPQKN